MSSLNSLYIKKETLETLLLTISKKKENGVELTINVSDEKNKYGQNVSAWVSQSKEQREAKKERYFVGNGKTFWESNVEPEPVEKKTDVRGINDDGKLPF